MSSFENKDSYNIKTVVLGNYATGKTTLITRLTTGLLRPFTESTIGCAYFGLNLVSKYGQSIKFQIWDTAGQEKYRALTELYYRNAEIIMLCFDVANKKTFQDIKVWLELINDKSVNQDKICFLIANKDDLEWDIDKKEVEEFAKHNNLCLAITSSVENRGISELLEMLLHNSDMKWGKNITYFKENNERIKLEQQTALNTNKCCNYIS